MLEDETCRRDEEVVGNARFHPMMENWQRVVPGRGMEPRS